MLERYLEDFEVGQSFGSGRLCIHEERIKSFAAEFDPQPFHLDLAAAEHTVFRGLAASGRRAKRSYRRERNGIEAETAARCRCAFSRFSAGRKIYPTFCIRRRSSSQTTLQQSVESTIDNDD